MENPYFARHDRIIGYQLKRVELLGEPNRTYAKQFMKWMERQNRMKGTISRRLSELVFILRALQDKDAKRATRKDIELILDAINGAKRKDGSGLAVISKGKLKMTLRKFYKFLLNSKGYPSIVDDIKPDQAKNALLPSDILSEGDVQKLIAACMNVRDKALISLLWSGMRIGELLSLRLKDVKVENDEVDVIVVGKTGQRAVSLMNPTYLVNYMHEMRSAAKPESSLFITLNNGVPTENWLDHDSLRRILYHLKARVPELRDRRIWPHLFRHSFASFLAAQNFNPEIMKRYFGWHSDMAQVYVHLNDQAVKDAIRALGKKQVKKVEPKMVPIVCWRCAFENEPDRTFCRKCTADLINPIKKSDEAARMRERIEKLEGALAMLLDRVPDKVKREILHQTPDR